MSQKKKREFPTAFTVLFIILILAAILTYIVPSGKFSRLTYDESTRDFIITDHNDETKAIPATQEVLNDLHIQLDLSKFEDGTIKKCKSIIDMLQKI